MSYPIRTELFFNPYIENQKLYLSSTYVGNRNEHDLVIQFFENNTAKKEYTGSVFPIHLWMYKKFFFFKLQIQFLWIRFF